MRRFLEGEKNVGSDDGWGSGNPDRRLVLWGITFGIVGDFLALLEGVSLDWWAWPTVSFWDVRFVLWMIGWRFRRGKERGLMRMRAEGEEAGEKGTPVIIDDGLEVRTAPLPEKEGETGKDGSQRADTRTGKVTPYSAAGYMLKVRRFTSAMYMPDNEIQSLYRDITPTYKEP